MATTTPQSTETKPETHLPPVTQTLGGAPLPDKPSPRKEQPKETSEKVEDYQKDDQSASIIVKNIAPSKDTENPTTQQLSNFFSFCGNISSLSLIPDESDPSTVSALVTFENSSAARTALLLNHTFLNDRSITIELAPYNLAVPHPAIEAPQDFPRLPAPESQESVVKNLLNQGYQLTVDALEKAKAYDQEHKISEQMGQMAKKVETQVNEIDSQYQISEKVNQVRNQVNAIDQQFGITDSISSVVQTASGQVQALDQEFHITDKLQQGLVSAQTKAAEIDTEYHITESISAGAEKVATEGVKLASTINQELNLDQRAKEAKEAISYGASQVANFIETNETVHEIGSFFSQIGTQIWGATVEPVQTKEEITQQTNPGAAI